MASFAKFVRPEQPRRGQITDRDLDILEAVLRYRFCSASQLVRLVPGNEDVTQRRLRLLWEWGLLSRWVFPGIRSHSEFHYYLDDEASLQLLTVHRGLIVLPEMLQEVRSHRRKDYAGAALRGQLMQLGFLQHSLMISRLHFMLELACRDGRADVQLSGWYHGSQLRGHKVQLPDIRPQRLPGSNDYLWEEQDRSVRLPVEPDAVFSLRFVGRPEPAFHFCYEADRGSMPLADVLKKLRAYYHFIKRQQQHKQAFGLHPIRAVLIETTDEARARQLMALAQHPAVIGTSARCGLFWFIITPVFLQPSEAEAAMRPLPAYLTEPSRVLAPLWALPDGSLHSLLDNENVRVPA